MSRDLYERKFLFLLASSEKKAGSKRDIYLVTREPNGHDSIWRGSGNPDYSEIELYLCQFVLSTSKVPPRQVTEITAPGIILYIKCPESEDRSAQVARADIDGIRLNAATFLNPSHYAFVSNGPRDNKLLKK